MKKTQFQEIYVSAFADSAPWRKWFFSEVVRRDDEIFIVDDAAGKPSAALLMQPYAFQYDKARRKRVTALRPTPFIPTEAVNTAVSYLPPVLSFDTASTSFPKGMPRP